MGRLDDLIDRAVAAPRPTREVTISLDAGISTQIDELRGQSEALQAQAAAIALESRFTDPRPAKIQKQIEELGEQIDAAEQRAAASLVTFRFTRLEAQAWAELVSRAPARPGSTLDDGYGYNYHQVCKAAAVQSGQQIEDGEDQPGDVPPETWQKLWTLISGNDLERICSAIFELNVWRSQADFLAGSRLSPAITATE